LCDAGEIHRLVDVALRRRAVAEQADRDMVLLAIFQRIADAGRMRRLRADRDTEWKILHRPRAAIATLVSAPEQQDVLDGDAAPEQRGIVAVGWYQYVVLGHGAGNTDRDGLL